MSAFSADWLSRREPADHAARRQELLQELPRRFDAIVDLGAGSGSNFRWLAPRLESPQHWTLIDNDRQLLAAARSEVQRWARAPGYEPEDSTGDLEIAGPGFAATVNTIRLDLCLGLAELELPAGGLVTASALLDLVSRDWLAALIERLSASRCFVLFALSYDGSVGFDPGLRDDAAIIERVNRHQLTDKGFGPALGPRAAAVAVDLLGRAGYAVETMASEWRCGADDGAMLEPLVEGWAEAAIAVEPTCQNAILAWRDLRLAQIAAQELAVTVGHRDLVARPPDQRIGGSANSTDRWHRVPRRRYRR